MAIYTKVTTELKGVTAKTKKMVNVGQFVLANQVHADCNRYVPMLSGHLRMHSYVTHNNKQVVWIAPYARRQYYNYGARFTTPGTGPLWDHKALAIHGPQWERVVQRAMNIR